MDIHLLGVSVLIIMYQIKKGRLEMDVTAFTFTIVHRSTDAFRILQYRLHCDKSTLDFRPKTAVSMDCVRTYQSITKVRELMGRLELIIRISELIVHQLRFGEYI